MARRAEVFMGIDPGLSKTGIVICRKDRNGKIRLEQEFFISTDSKLPLPTRYEHIRMFIRDVIKEYGVTRVICEAYEVRTYQVGPRKSGVAMSKLINEISAEVYNLSLPFLLSSPDVRKYVSEADISDYVKGLVLKLPKYKREHILDAYAHIVFNEEKGRGRGGHRG